MINHEAEMNQLKILDHVQFGLFAITRTYDVIYWNKCLEGWTGLNREEIVGNSLIDFYPHLDEPRYKSRLESIFQGGAPIIFSSHIHKYIIPAPHPKGDHRIQHTVVTAIPASHGTEFFALFSIEDVTDLTHRIAEYREAQEALRIATNEAMIANKAKSDFLANMSHEIRTPMNAILGFTEVLEDMLTNETERKFLESISSAGKSLLGLINDILDLSKIEAGRLEIRKHVISPTAIMKDIEQIFSYKVLKKNLRFTMQLADDLPEKIWLDEIRVRQILLNLIGNAVKFTDQGCIELGLTHSLYRDTHDKCDLIFTVKDTGIGIPPEKQEEIFQAFIQASTPGYNTQGGTGLGLTITKRLVEMMNGEITVESKVDSGSKFQVILKNVLIAKEDSISPILEGAEKTSQFAQGTILVVDDIKANRDLIRALLREEDLTFVEATNGIEALQEARRCFPDVIFMDMKMPKMNGMEAIRHLKEDAALRNIPVIVVTAFALKEEENDIRESGCDGYLRKPINKNDLINQLKAYIPHLEKQEKESEIVITNDDSRQSGKPTSPPLQGEAILPETLTLLQNDMLQEWKLIKKSFILNKIETFGKQVKSFGSEHQITSLSNWGENVINQARSFDMEKLPSTLDRFPVIVQEIANS